MLLDLLAPPRCGGCGAPLVRTGVRPSRPARWPWLPPEPVQALPGWCGPCLDRWGPVPGAWPDGAAGCPGWGAAVYRGRVRRAVLQAKRGAPQAACSLLVARLPPAGRGAAPADAPDHHGAVVSWIPAHPRRAVTGPDAGAVLAAAVAARLGLSCRPLLIRSPLGRRQAGLSTTQRRSSPERIGLRAVGNAPPAVLLVDDVRTTGTTLDHAAALLRAKGAAGITAVVVACAPAQG